MTRDGPFWDAVEGRVPPPPAAVLLGWELTSIDPEAGTIEVAYTAGEQFLNPVGVIHRYRPDPVDSLAAWAAADQATCG